ncbi:MAG TPA: acetylglutamate kinase [Porphyromonadaceae bacterium]|nr:acetylglutamate kinase [Porphyromonadaceae bacterium]
MVKEKLTLIKVGGKIVEEEESLHSLLDDFSKVYGNKILVHGGGRSATALASRMGIESKMVEGRRITDREMLKIVTMVYAGWVNKQIVAKLQSRSVNALGLCGADLDAVFSQKRPVKEIDYGYVGDVKEVNGEILSKLITNGIVPIVAPITHDREGNLLNTNADTMAGEIAKGLVPYFSVSLVYCFEKKGVLQREDDEDSVIHTLTPESYYDFKAKGIITGGMIPKVENALKALEAGVSEIIITHSSDLKGERGTRICK